MLEIKNLIVFYENALALNNVTFTCREGEITGVFGPNGAGKSTLMFTISGIILDMKKTEIMMGGERITILGEIQLRGEDTIQVKPSERTRRGIVLCPERRRIFPESSTLENLKIGGYLATRKEAKKTLEYVFSLFPALKELKKKRRWLLEWRRAANACHWQGINGPTKAIVAGRTLNGTQSGDPIKAGSSG
jgi:branched-chain amino acid transport system ATP-binding protein